MQQSNICRTEAQSLSDFEVLFTTYQSAMYRIAYAILRDDGLAEDAVQQTFLKLLKEFPKIESITSNKTKSFIVILVRNTAIDLYRKRKRENIVYLDEIDVTQAGCVDSPEDQVLSSQGCEVMKEALLSLDERYSDILMLRYFHGYRNKEIAALLSLSEAVVASRIFQGKRLLTKRLKGGEVFG